MTNSTDYLSYYQTINKLNTTEIFDHAIISSFEQRIFDLLNEKIDSN